MSTLTPFCSSSIGYDLNACLKNIKLLIKYADNIIKPNGYTLDLIPLTLFSIDILDWQISANNVSVGQL